MLISVSIEFSANGIIVPRIWHLILIGVTVYNRSESILLLYLSE